MAGFDPGSWFAIPFKTTGARARLAELQETAQELRDSITLEVKRSYLQLARMILQLDVAGTALNQTTENRKDVAARYTTGLVLKSGQLEAELEQLKAGLVLTQAKIDYELALIDLELVTGVVTVPAAASDTGTGPGTGTRIAPGAGPGQD